MYRNSIKFFLLLLLFLFLHSFSVHGSECQELPGTQADDYYTRSGYVFRPTGSPVPGAAYVAIRLPSTFIAFLSEEELRYVVRGAINDGDIDRDCNPCFYRDGDGDYFSDCNEIEAGTDPNDPYDIPPDMPDMYDPASDPDACGWDGCDRDGDDVNDCIDGDCTGSSVVGFDFGLDWDSIGVSACVALGEAAVCVVGVFGVILLAKAGIRFLRM